MSSLSDISTIKQGIKVAPKNIIKTLHNIIFENEGDRNNRKRLREFTGFVFENDKQQQMKVDFIKENMTYEDVVSACIILGVDSNKIPQDELGFHLCCCLEDLSLLAKNDDNQAENEDDENGSTNDDDEEKHKDDEERRKDEEIRKTVEERRKDDEERRKVEEERRKDVEEKRKYDEERRKDEEERRKYEERRKNVEERRKYDEERRKDEEERRKYQERPKDVEERRKVEEKIRKNEEKRRYEEVKRRDEEKIRKDEQKMCKVAFEALSGEEKRRIHEELGDEYRKYVFVNMDNDGDEDYEDNVFEGKEKFEFSFAKRHSEEETSSNDGRTCKYEDIKSRCRNTQRTSKDYTRKRTDDYRRMQTHEKFYTDDDEEEYSDDNIRRGNERSQFSLTFRDVEESVRAFDGKQDYSVERFIDDFEENAAIFRWNEMLKLVFAKKLLKGVAKLFIQSEEGLKSWDKLKSALNDEFGSKTNSADVHRMLSKRKRKSDESMQEYFLIMKELACKGKIEHDALFQYVIDGVSENLSNKSVLYGAKSVKDFKDKLEIYEKISKQYPVQQNRPCKDDKRKYHEHTELSDTDKRKQGLRCFNCGSMGHRSTECSHKSKGPKCCKCNLYGHKAVECDRESDSTKATLTVQNEVSNSENKLMLKRIEINGIKINALVDTGSAVNIINQKTYELIDEPKLQSTTVTLVGFGQQEVSPLGYFQSEVVIDDEIFPTTIYVVSTGLIKVDAILGVELLCQAEIIINQDGISIKKQSSVSLLHISTYSRDAEDISIDTEAGQEEKKMVRYLVETYAPKRLTERKDTNIERSIILNDEKPIYQRPRSLPFPERQVSNQVEEWLADGIVEHSSSEYASPVVVVPKKDGSKRVCIDYRKITKVVVKDRYPLPLIEDQLDRMQLKHVDALRLHPMFIMRVKMRDKTNLDTKRLLQEEQIQDFVDSREECRQHAKQRILKTKDENRRTYNLRRRPASQYRLGKLVKIKKTQFGSGLKLKSKFLGPYQVTHVKQNSTYDVGKEGVHEGLCKTSTCAEFMKKWAIYDASTSSESDEDQDSRNVGTRIDNGCNPMTTGSHNNENVNNSQSTPYRQCEPEDDP